MEQLFHGGRSKWAGLAENDRPKTEPPFILGPSNSNVNSLLGPAHKEDPDPYWNAGTWAARKRFLYSEDDGQSSDYLRCFYEGQQAPLLCEKIPGCCIHGCCPKDSYWLGGLWVLIIFVIIIFVLTFVVAVVCYQKQQNRKQRENNHILNNNNNASYYEPSNPSSAVYYTPSMLKSGYSYSRNY